MVSKHRERPYRPVAALEQGEERANCEAERPLWFKLRSPVSNGGTFLLPLLT